MTPAIGIRTCSVPCTESGFGPRELGHMHESGFRLAELSFNRPAFGVRFDDLERAQILKSAASDLGMRFVSHAPDEFWLSNPDRSELATTIEATAAVVRGAGTYGAEAMVIHCCPGKALMRNGEAQMAALVDALTQLAPVCEEAGVRLAAETMVPGRLTSSMDRLIAAVDQVGSPWVGICLDTNHLNLSEDVDDAVRRAGDRLFEFHLNDNHFVKEEHLLPYEGEIDWSGLAQAMAAIHYEGHLIMEPGGHYGDDILARARRASDRLGNELAAARQAIDRQAVD